MFKLRGGGTPPIKIERLLAVFVWKYNCYKIIHRICYSIPLSRAESARRSVITTPTLAHRKDQG